MARTTTTPRPRSDRGRGVAPTRGRGAALAQGRGARGRGRGARGRGIALVAVSAVCALLLAGCSGSTGREPDGSYPWHTRIVSTTFWVGEIFDPNASDGSQVLSTYDGKWEEHYGGCDGVASTGGCETERRTAADDWFPTAMTPRENPFYLDLPYDDVNDATGFRDRDRVVPWASEQRYREHRGDQGHSYMKNRWVEIRKGDRTCYGQIEDAGPGQYHDAAYVFGTDDARPANRKFNGAGMDVSPALNGCLGFAELNGEDDRVDWRFVDRSDVPDGPWTKLVTTSGLTE